MPGIRVRAKSILGNSIRLLRGRHPNRRVVVSGSASGKNTPAAAFNFRARKNRK